MYSAFPTNTSRDPSEQMQVVPVRSHPSEHGLLILLCKRGKKGLQLATRSLDSCQLHYFQESSQILAFQRRISIPVQLWRVTLLNICFNCTSLCFYLLVHKSNFQGLLLQINISCNWKAPVRLFMYMVSVPNKYTIKNIN